MKIVLNLASRPFADLRPLLKAMRTAMGVLAGVALTLAVLLHFVLRHDAQASLRGRAMDKAIAAASAERQGYEQMMQEPRNAKVLDETEALNGLFDEKAFSWTRVMKDIETVLPGPAQLAEIEPVRAKDGHVTLRIRVVGPHADAIQMVENMEHSSRFRLPRIVGEGPQADANSNGAQGPVSEATPEELDVLTEYNLAVPVASAATTAQTEPAVFVPTPKQAAGGAK